MKITPQRLREIIIEEVIKEDEGPPPNVVEKWPTPLADETIGPAIGVLLSDKPADEAADIISQVFSYLYGSEGVEQMAEPEEEMRRTIRSPGQKHATEVPVDAPEQKTITGLHTPRGVNEVIQEEYYIYLIEEAYYNKNFLLESHRLSTAEAEKIINDDRYNRSEQMAAEMDIETNKREGEPAHEPGGPSEPIINNPMRNTITRIDQIAEQWKSYIDRGGSLRTAIEQTKREETGETVIDALAALLGDLQQAKRKEDYAQHGVAPDRTL